MRGEPVHENTLGDRTQLGKGGMAIVYDIPSYIVASRPNDRWVYKRYKRKQRPDSAFGMHRLVEVREAVTPQRKKVIDRYFNWPQAVVVDDNPGAAGVVLPILPPEFFVDVRLSSGSRARTPAEGQYLFMDAGYCKRVGIPYPTPEQRRLLVGSLVQAMRTLERLDVVYGDLSSKNFLWRLSPQPQVMFVDCDSIRIKGAAPAFGKQPHTVDWEPPEAKLAKARKDDARYTLQSHATDRYKLGLAILRVLTPGPRCAERLDPTAVRPLLPAGLYRLLELSLSDDWRQRPSAEQWLTEMKR